MKHRSLLALGAAAILTLAANGVQAQTYTSGFNGEFPGGSQDQTVTTTGFGQYFSTTGGTLSSLTFADYNYSNAGTKLIVQAFNTATMRATGAILYNGFGTTTGNGDSAWADGNGGYLDGTYYHTFSNIGVNLTAGTSYVAYLVDAPGTDTFNGSTTYGYTYDENGNLVTDGPNNCSQFGCDDNGTPVATPGAGGYSFLLGRNVTSLGGAAVSQASNGVFTQQADISSGALNDGGLFQADYSITITPAAVAPVPEVATWAMMIAGFGLAGAALRRRRSVAVTFAA